MIFEYSHDDTIIDRTMELEAQLDYLRRMSRYDNLMEQQESSTNENPELIEKIPSDDQQELKSSSDITMSHEEYLSSDESHIEKFSSQSEQHFYTSPNSLLKTDDGLNQQSTDSLDYHSVETDLNQLSSHRTVSDTSLHSTSSIYNDDHQQTLLAQAIDLTTAYASEPIGILEHTMDSQLKQRVNTTDNVNNDDKPRFQSAYDLHDEEKSILVRSPELYNMKSAIKNDHRSLGTNSQIQHRTLSESALATDDTKRPKFNNSEVMKHLLNF